ncbi:MAG: dTDP-4-dehydrorhamnose reductase [candidate division WOR-3 bacterium]|nr:dTDP-4-dehydrorhamnose reductase [candidate division WOR-3 bacterium]
MKFLITGSKGLLGSEFDRIIENDKLSLSRQGLDITAFENVYKVVKEYKPDIIINCSAISNVDYCEVNQNVAFLVNAIGVENLLKCAIEFNIFLVHFSTDYVFDGNKKEPYKISDIPNPINVYGKSKLKGEEIILNSGYEKYLIIRTSWLFGNGKSSLVDKIISLSKNEIIYMTEQISNPTYAKDLAIKVLDMIKKGYFGLFHLTGSLSVSRYELARFILEKIGYKGKIVKVDSFPSIAKRPNYSALNNFPLEPLRDYKTAILEFLRY